VRLAQFCNASSLRCVSCAGKLYPGWAPTQVQPVRSRWHDYCALHHNHIDTPRTGGFCLSSHWRRHLWDTGVHVSFHLSSNCLFLCRLLQSRAKFSLIIFLSMALSFSFVPPHTKSWRRQMCLCTQEVTAENARNEQQCDALSDAIHIPQWRCRLFVGKAKTCIKRHIFSFCTFIHPSPSLHLGSYPVFSYVTASINVELHLVASLPSFFYRRQMNKNYFSVKQPTNKISLLITVIKIPVHR